ITPVDPTRLGVSPVWVYWNVVRLLSGTAIFSPFCLRLDSEALHEGPGILEGAPVHFASAGSEPIAPIDPTGFGINPIGCSWDIVRLSSGTAICAPLSFRLESEVLHESLGLREAPPTSFALAVSKPIAHADPT